jgi:hypothetical protein
MTSVTFSPIISLQVGQTAQEQHALDQLVGVLHLIDGFFVFLFRQDAQAPVGQHARMQEILIDGGELVLQHLVEERDGDRIAGDGGVRGGARGYSAACCSARRLSSSIPSIVSWHRPQFFLTPQRA